jgi:hypothetical protein
MPEERDIQLRAQLRDAALYWRTPPMTLDGIATHVYDFILSYDDDGDRAALWMGMLDDYRWILQSMPEMYLFSLRSLQTRLSRQTLHRFWDAHHYKPDLAGSYQTLKSMAELLLDGEFDNNIQVQTIGRMCRVIPLADWPSVASVDAVVGILTRLPMGQRTRCLGAIVNSCTAQVDVNAPAHTDDQTMIMLRPLLATNPLRFDDMLQAVFLNWPQVGSIQSLVGAWGFRYSTVDELITMHNNRILFARHRLLISNGKERREFVARDTKIATNPEDGEPLDPLDKARTCILCMDNKRCIAFATCGHFVCCAKCSAECNVCPVCRAPITRRTYTYLA